MILLISPKKVFATKRLIKEAKNLKVALRVFDAKDMAKRGFKVDIKQYQTFFIRQGWPYTKEIISLAKKFHIAGKKVVDASITAGSLGRDKWADYQKLKAANLPIPKTKSLILNPLLLTYPCLVKWNYGFKGKGVFLVKNKNQVKSILEKYPKEELLAQEFILAEYEYKIITVGYKSLPVILRFKIDKKTKRLDFTKTKIIRMFQRHPERSEGSQKDSLSLDKLRIQNDKARKLVKIAEKAARVLRRELAKIDILESQGKFYILEVNRWPGLKSFEQLTGYNVFRDFIKYLIK